MNDEFTQEVVIKKEIIMEDELSAISMMTPTKKYKRKSRKFKDKKLKKLLAALVENETVIWDRTSNNHNRNDVRLAAWTRISSKMQDFNGNLIKYVYASVFLTCLIFYFFICIVNECKAMWKSIRDAYRYRRNKNKHTKNGGVAAEMHEDEADDENSNWEFKGNGI